MSFNLYHILIISWNLGSPVLVDIDNDGHVEVLVAVSYYFDKEEYAGKDLDFDPSLYVAGGLACWDLEVGRCVGGGVGWGSGVGVLCI